MKTPFPPWGFWESKLLKWGYIVDYIWGYYRAISGDTGSSEFSRPKPQTLRFRVPPKTASKLKIYPLKPRQACKLQCKVQGLEILNDMDCICIYIYIYIWYNMIQCNKM